MGVLSSCVKASHENLSDGNLPARAAETADPHESSLDLLAGMSYLQAFSDGNKRTARLLASFPLLRAGLAPLSFVGWEKRDYTVGLVVYYEIGDPSILADGFVKNQIENAPVYHDLIRAHRVPHRIEVTKRKEIAAAITAVLQGHKTVEAALEIFFRKGQRDGTNSGDGDHHRPHEDQRDSVGCLPCFDGGEERSSVAD